MKIVEGLNIIEKGWIRKPTGFRVRFDKKIESGYEVGYSPPQEASPLTSDVTAWRYAWKLGQATRTEAAAGDPGAIYNIVVVDTDDQPIRFYATGKLETYNPLPIDQGIREKIGPDHSGSNGHTDD